jgi:hypothetical protein
MSGAAVIMMMNAQHNAEQAAQALSSLYMPPTIVRFNSESEALDVLTEAVAKVFPAYKVTGFKDKQLAYVDEKGKNMLSESVKGRAISNVFVVSIDYGNFYAGVDYRVWLIADYVLEILLKNSCNNLVDKKE